MTSRDVDRTPRPAETRRRMSNHDELTKIIQAVTDRWEEPLDEVHDIPQIVNAILASDWLTQVKADTVEPVEPILALLHYRPLYDSEQNRADVKGALDYVRHLMIEAGRMR